MTPPKAPAKAKKTKEETIVNVVDKLHPKDKRVLCIPSGSTLLDCVLGGGYAIGRMVQVAGSESTGKTQLAIEAAANFHRTYPKGQIAYVDAEAAFDIHYGERLGLPSKVVKFLDCQTVEQFCTELDSFCDAQPDDGTPSLFILDSLDALSTDDEMNTAINDMGGYGAEKAKLLGQIFRRLVQKMDTKNVCLFIISQVRDAIGSKFGGKTVSGGNAPKFYASQILRLTKLETLKRTISSIESKYGVTIKAECKKNKVGTPFKECAFDILFGYGIDDVTSCVEFIFAAGKQGELPTQLVETTDSKTKQTKFLDRPAAVVKRVYEQDDEEDIRLSIRAIQVAATKVWNDIHDQFTCGYVPKYVPTGDN